MISVAIMINGNPIMARSAVNKGEVDKNRPECVYKLDDGTEIIHDPDDGAVKLAIEMLETIKEQTHDR